jgi:hypothetical protein
MIAADRFVAGAPQHDDMTLLVVRVKQDEPPVDRDRAAGAVGDSV